jgi:predicted AAA+ superfamily ATPase
MARYSLRNYDLLKKLAEYMLTNDTKQNSVNSISRALGYNYNTANDYIDYLKQVYMLFELRNYSYSLKKQLASDMKYYVTDTGFVNTMSFSFSGNIGRLYENVVFNELKRRNKEMFFLNENGYECDFIVQDAGRITEAYQVCYDLNEDNKKREIKGLLAACSKFGLDEGVIITESSSGVITEGEIKIKLIPVTLFLLGFDWGV